MNASTILMIIEIIKLIQALQASQNPDISEAVTNNLVNAAIEGTPEEKKAVSKGLAEIDILGFLGSLFGARK